ncbi:MAG: uroporphyrinogen decarboxylase family protein [Polyangiales bacterium]
MVYFNGDRLGINAQIAAGADTVQIFDSWIGCLSEAHYRRYVLPHMRTIFSQLDRSVPSIYFGTGNPRLYGAMSEAGGDVIGVDWRISLSDAWQAIGSDRAIMGNLDPAAILATRDAMFAQTQAVLDDAGGRTGHVFNLGHGIMPGAKVDQVRALVDYVHERSSGQ